MKLAIGTVRPSALALEDAAGVAADQSVRILIAASVR
jgi:hypothetical protein